MEPQMPRDRDEASPHVPGEQADRRGVGRGASWQGPGLQVPAGG